MKPPNNNFKTNRELNPQKVAFISCINDEALYQRCRQYIEELVIPPGINIEFKEIRGAKGMASAYNQAILESTAKYKVYLHQDTFIYHKNLISEIINCFTKYPKIGMLGAVGGTKLPPSGIWFEDGWHSYGKVWEYRRPGIKLPFLPSFNQRKKRLVRFRPFSGEYQPVLVIDGLVMITQYDLPWREDLYDSFLYYEGPHCLEFIKNGYQVALPYQKNPWFMHWGPETDRTPEEHRKMWEKIRANSRLFVREYAAYIDKDIKNILNN